MILYALYLCDGALRQGMANADAADRKEEAAAEAAAGGKAAALAGAESGAGVLRQPLLEKDPAGR